MSQLSLIDQTFPLKTQLELVKPSIQIKIMEICRQDQVKRSKEEWLKSVTYKTIFTLICESIEDLSQLVIPFPCGIKM